MRLLLFFADVLPQPGQTLLDIAFENGVDIEGACGGRCACSTCHVILNVSSLNSRDGAAGLRQGHVVQPKRQPVVLGGVWESR